MHSIPAVIFVWASEVILSSGNKPLVQYLVEAESSISKSLLEYLVFCKIQTQHLKPKLATATFALTWCSFNDILTAGDTTFRSKSISVSTHSSLWDVIRKSPLKRAWRPYRKNSTLKINDYVNALQLYLSFCKIWRWWDLYWTRAWNQNCHRWRVSPSFKLGSI